MEKLNSYEQGLVRALIRANDEGLTDLSEPFSSRHAVDMLCEIPTVKGSKRMRGYLPNKYKMCHIMRKSGLFDCEVDPSGRRWWTLKSD
jgi:hypothetical protein